MTMRYVKSAEPSRWEALGDKHGPARLSALEESLEAEAIATRVATRAMAWQLLGWLARAGYAIGYRDDDYVVLLDDKGDERRVAQIIEKILDENC